MLRNQIGPYLMSNRVRDPKLGNSNPAVPNPNANANEGVKGLMLTAAVTTSGGACLVQFPDEMRIYPDDACLHSLNQLLGVKQKDPVQVQYH
jgi:DNA polymerase-3 subunit alpha